MVGGAVTCPTANLARLYGCQAARRPDSSSPSGAGDGGAGQGHNAGFVPFQYFKLEALAWSALALGLLANHKCGYPLVYA